VDVRGFFCSGFGSLIGKISKSVGVCGMLWEHLSKVVFFQGTKEVDNLLVLVLFQFCSKVSNITDVSY